MTPDTPPAKRRQSAASGADIPEDILLTEVLVRLPVRSLLRFRSVCQSWRATINDPSFVCRHLELSSNRTAASVLDVPCEPRLEEQWGMARSKEMEFRRIQPGEPAASAELMHAVAWPENGFTAVTQPVHCDGMVLIPTASGELFICNPATREFVELPPGSPSDLTPTVAFGFDPYSNRYKVARIFYREFEGEDGVELNVRHEILTLGGDGSWEPTDDPPYYVTERRPICTWGAFYWTAAAVCCSSEQWLTGLLRFCLHDETFTAIHNPPCFSKSSHEVIGEHDTFTELSGKLCFVHAFAATTVDIWMADGGPYPEWSLACRIELLRPIVHSVLPLAVDGDDGLLLSVDRRMLYRYNVRSDALEEVVDMQRAPDLYGGKPPLPLCLLHHAVPYVESLVSISRPNY